MPRHGGYTAVCTMPNLDPVPDSAEHLQVQLDAIKRGAAIKVLPYGAITVGEKGEKLADMEAYVRQSLRVLRRRKRRAE